MNGRRGVRYTDIATASGSTQTKLDWLQSFIASNDPKGRPIATTAVGSSFWSDRLALQSGSAVSIGHTATGPAASYDIMVMRADKGDSVSYKSSAQPVDAGFYAGCTTRQILVDDFSLPGWKRWNVVISRGGQVVRKIPITIGAALATADY